jgi:hypothetical protein
MASLLVRTNKRKEGGRGLSSRYRGVEGHGGVTGGRERTTRVATARGVDPE